jgi:hypothetical protein
MPRTTVNIDAPVLRDLKRLQKRERKPLGQLMSELLAQALGGRRPERMRQDALAWTARPMRARVDLTDKEAVQRSSIGTPGPTIKLATPCRLRG